MTTTATDRVYYLVESSGPTRQVWGPYTLAAARRAAGKRHVIVTGGGLVNGQTMTRGEFRAALQSRRLCLRDGSSLDGI